MFLPICICFIFLDGWPFAINPKPIVYLFIFQDYTASEDIMDISSYAPSISSHVTSLPNAIPTSVITPTTSLTGGSWLEHPNNIHGGSFVPPPVSSHNGYHSPAVVRGGGGLGGQHPHHPHQRIVRERSDLDMYRMSPSTGGRRRGRDDDVSRNVSHALLHFSLQVKVDKGCKKGLD